MLIITLVAMICNVSGDVPLCHQQVITDSTVSSITLPACMSNGMLGVAQWMGEHPEYSEYKVTGFKCVAERHKYIPTDGI